MADLPSQKKGTFSDIISIATHLKDKWNKFQMLMNNDEDIIFSSVYYVLCKQTNRSGNIHIAKVQ